MLVNSYLSENWVNLFFIIIFWFWCIQKLADKILILVELLYHILRSFIWSLYILYQNLFNDSIWIHYQIFSFRISCKTKIKVVASRSKTIKTSVSLFSCYWENDKTKVYEYICLMTRHELQSFWCVYWIKRVVISFMRLHIKAKYISIFYCLFPLCLHSIQFFSCHLSTSKMKTMLHWNEVDVFALLRGLFEKPLFSLQLALNPRSCHSH